MPKPYVVTVHDLSALLYHRQKSWRNQLQLFQARRGLRRSGKIIAVSAATQRDVANLLGIPREQIRQIYNAPDPRFVEDSSASESGAKQSKAHLQEQNRILERYQIDYPFVLYAGNIRPQKNIPRLIEAFAVLRGDLETHPVFKNLRLIIIGDEISRYPRGPSICHAKPG